MERKVSVRRRRYRKPWAEKCKDYFRNFLAFMFSNVGIIGLVVGYTVAGALIFGLIEKDRAKPVIMDKRIAEAERIWNITYNCNVFEETKWKESVSYELIVYQNIITNAIRNGYDGSDDDTFNESWHFQGAFLYALTVITTVGYGNVVPRTSLGKVITIIYAIIGMPLFLLYLSNIGDIMARSFKWLYAKLCLCRCCPGLAKKREERQRQRAAEASVEYFSNQDGSESPEVSITRESFQGTHRVTYRSEDDSEEQSETLTEASYDSQTVTVPVTICFAIMAGYILSGGVLFSIYENWSLFDASYFCFISLSTIGLGDLVPGKTIYGATSFQLRSILGAIYLMFGMALTAMCFNLMQEEVINKIRRTVRGVKYMFQCNR